MDKYHPGYFGKIGMRHYHLTKNKYHCPTVNLEKVWTLITEQQREQAKKEGAKVPVIDVSKAGYFKVLGKGRFPERPVIIKAKYFSRRAEDKIKKAGGAAVLTA